MTTIVAPETRANVHEHPDPQLPVDPLPESIGCPTGLARSLPCHPSSIGSARRAVDELDGWLQPTLLADLRLLVSELVANSVEHGPRRDGRPIWLGLSISNERVRVEVQDGGRGFTPTASRPAVDAASGRGLYIVDQLAAGWGVTGADGTCVWFELDRDVPGIRTAA